MACCQPFKIDNPNYNVPGTYRWYMKYIEVPCGWCLNCRVDKQNWLSDAMTYEYKNYNYIGAFVTFTYDDIYIEHCSNFNNDDFILYEGELLCTSSDKELIYSLRREDVRNFMKRLRSRINYLYKTHNIKNVDLCRKDFKVAYSGEYGDSFGRPHYHFCFFGLDWNFCSDLFQECWQMGIVDVKPIKSGCFEYITKYLIKQVHGEQAKELYDNKGLERPFFYHSLGLGKGLILEQFDFIRKHNLCYRTIDDTLRPIPIYYRNFYFHLRPKLDFSVTENNMIQAGYSRSDDIPTFHRYSLKQMNEYKHEQALLRERQLEKECENKLVPYNPILQDLQSSYYSEDYNIKDLAIYGDIVPF